VKSTGDLRENTTQEGLSISDFELITKLGKGAYGSVYLVKRKSTGDKYAMKMV
jgi:serine/threonine-protein kinase RIM15